MTRIPGDSYDIRAMMPKGMFDAHRALVSAMWHEGTIDTRLRELLRLKSAEVCGCERCKRVRFSEGQDEGVTEADVAAVANPAASDLSEREQTALMFAELLSTTADGITDELFDEMRRWFTDAQIVELSFFVLTYNMLQRFNAAIDLDTLAGDEIVIATLEDYKVQGEDDSEVYRDREAAYREAAEAAAVR